MAQPDTIQVKEIFSSASALPMVERAAFLDQACAGDAELRAEVEAYLSAAAETGLMGKPGETSDHSLPLAERPGSLVGRYKLLQQIGEGGFGVVFMAEQEHPVRRKVALKVIKLGMDTRQVIARFEAERQALAMMDHPSVAKVFDGGATETGRPYFVMELVKGTPITEYCDKNKLSVPQRLDLFAQVCQAVQHAHQKGLIHRDIKPGNVLVATADDRPVVKVIDFGIAKAMQARLTEKTLFTEFHQLVGTPEYMSPEQAEGGLDVDTRSDVYSLGVLLYELLAGSPPFDPGELRSHAFAEMQRIIREVEPPAPSTRLNAIKDTLPSVAAQRAIEPRKLQTMVRGELDWIVMRCLEKDRKRRYQTAIAVAEDLGRYLTDQSVQARPPTRTYRMRKFIRRNKAGVLAGGAVVAALLVGLALASMGFVQARRLAIRADREATNARTQAARSEQVAQFLKETLAAAGPSVAHGRDAALLREILDKTAERVEKDLKDQPEVQGDLWITLGSTYRDIGDELRAITMFQHAVESYRLALGNESAKLANALGKLGRSQSFTGDVKAGKANTHLGLEMARKCPDASGAILASCLLDVASSFQGFGLTGIEGEPFAREAVALRKQSGSNPIALADSLNTLAETLAATKPAEAEPLMREALALQRQHLEPDHPSIANSLLSLGQLLLNQGKLEEAETINRQTYDLWVKVYDKNHPYRQIVLRFLVDSLILQGKRGEAEALVRDEFKAKPTNANGLWTMSESELWVYVYQDVGRALQAQGKIDEALNAFGKAVEFAPDNTESLRRLASGLEATGKFSEAISARQKIIKLEPKQATGYNALAWLLATATAQEYRDPTQAVALATRAVELTPQDSNHWNTLGVARYRAGQWQGAVEALQKTMELHPPDALDWFFLAMADQRLGERAKARACYDKAVKWMGENQAPRNVDLIRFRAEAAEVLGITMPTPPTPSTLPVPRQ